MFSNFRSCISNVHSNSAKQKCIFLPFLFLLPLLILNGRPGDGNLWHTVSCDHQHGLIAHTFFFFEETVLGCSFALQGRSVILVSVRV